jgi:hypothetical protein
MTKTLALVSAIARTDFNLLEPNELDALTDQLEHLLLVPLPEQEIPDKTRLSFAATRLTRITECRLACDERSVQIQKEIQILKAALGKDGATDIERQRKANKLADAHERLKQADIRRKKEVSRAFQLIRRVLRERPDRVRLWTRAILMCRLTGARGLASLQEEIDRIHTENPLAAEYLQANMLVFLGTQVLAAAQTICDEASAKWQRDAARHFLEEFHKLPVKSPRISSTFALFQTAMRLA